MKPLSKEVNDDIEHPKHFEVNAQVRYYMPLIKWYAMRVEHEGVDYLKNEARA